VTTLALTTGGTPLRQAYAHRPNVLRSILDKNKAANRIGNMWKTQRVRRQHAFGARRMELLTQDFDMMNHDEL